MTQAIATRRRITLTAQVGLGKIVKRHERLSLFNDRGKLEELAPEALNVTARVELDLLA